MKKIVWDESLSVGVEAIDAQHRTWIEHYNRVADAIEGRGGPTPVTTTLGFLIDYTELHFTTEQGFMTQTRYPGMSEHVAKHDELRETVAHLVEDFEDEGATPALDQAVETFLGNWLVTHIRDVDQLFGAYVKEQGITLS
jgi:hemerythrin